MRPTAGPDADFEPFSLASEPPAEEVHPMPGADSTTVRVLVTIALVLLVVALMVGVLAVARL